MENIDYSYISSLFIVVCPRCEYAVGCIHNHKEASDIANAHREYMAEIGRGTNHDSNIVRVAR